MNEQKKNDCEWGGVSCCRRSFLINANLCSGVWLKQREVTWRGSALDNRNLSAVSLMKKSAQRRGNRWSFLSLLFLRLIIPSSTFPSSIKIFYYQTSRHVVFLFKEIYRIQIIHDSIQANFTVNFQRQLLYMSFIVFPLLVSLFFIFVSKVADLLIGLIKWNDGIS